MGFESMTVSFQGQDWATDATHDESLFVYNVHILCCPPVPGMERLVRWCEEMQGEIKELQRQQTQAVDWKVQGQLPPTPTSPQPPQSIHEAAYQENKQYLAQLDCVQVSAQIRGWTCLTFFWQQWRKKMLGDRGAGWAWHLRCRGCGAETFLTYFSARWRSSSRYIKGLALTACTLLLWMAAAAATAP